MRAVILDKFGGPEALQPAEVARPEPLPTEVLVAVQAAGINPVDYKTRAGEGVAGLLGDPPLILGWDACGTVEAVGPGVTRFAPGDEVFGMPWFPRLGACYAEYVTAPSRQFAAKPRALSAAQAGALPLAALTAWQALVDTAAVGVGQRVLIHAAAGGVGHLAVQIAKVRGAEVIGTARAHKHEFLAEIGVDEAIDYTSTRFEEAVAEIDVVIDLIGGDDYGTRSLQVLKPEGLLIAVPGGVSKRVAKAAEKQGKRATGILVEPDGAALEQIAVLAGADELRVELAAEVPLEQAAAAHELGEQGRIQGKIVLTV